LSGVGGVLRPGIVHRIDKDTSGLLVVAKNDKAHVSLAKQIAEKSCHRIYLALLEGSVKEDKGRIVTDIGRSPNDRLKMAVLPAGKGKIAITDYEVLTRYGTEFTLCRFTLQTGRTHQIRVHSKYMGNPIVGDPLYGVKKQKFSLNGQLLHASKLILTHPSTGEEMEFVAPLPAYFKEILEKLDKKYNVESGVE
jgi:23S rRNA pseudouridine1911/1915/1917 synthase